MEDRRGEDVAGRRVNDIICESDTCQYHNATDVVINDLRGAVHKILEGQTEMRDTVIKLTEAMKGIDRLDRNMEKLQERWEEKDKAQDLKIDELKAFMYKTMGGVAVVSLVVGYFLRVVLPNV